MSGRLGEEPPNQAVERRCLGVSYLLSLARQLSYPAGRVLNAQGLQLDGSHVEVALEVCQPALERRRVGDGLRPQIDDHQERRSILGPAPSGVVQDVE